MMAQVSRPSESLARMWCSAMHPEPMWPMNGSYRWRRCYREYRVTWEPVRKNRELSPAFKAIATAVLVLLAVPAPASPLLPEGGVIRTVQRELLVLPGYTVFDYLAAKELEDGSIVLTGSVTRAALKAAAEEAVRSAAAGTTIVNRIEVLPHSQRDERLRNEAWRAIYGDPTMVSYSTRKLLPIHIVVKNGTITLEGTVDSSLHRMDAEVALQHLAAAVVRNRLIAVQDAGGTTMSSIWRSLAERPSVSAKR